MRASGSIAIGRGDCWSPTLTICNRLSRMFDAARRDRPDVLALLLDIGFSLETQDHTGKRALHEAAASNALGAVKFLVERGADVDPRESSYNGTPISWAAYGDKMEMVHFLSRYSRDIWTLCFHGFVERVREIVTEDPRRAQVVSKDGYTLLWWLPDDEAERAADRGVAGRGRRRPGSEEQGRWNRCRLGATPRHGERGGSARDGHG